MDRLDERVSLALHLRAVRKSHPKPLSTGVVFRLDEDRPRSRRAPKPLALRADQEEAAVLDDAVGAELDLVRMRQTKALHGRDRNSCDALHEGVR
jgi:hypothetical protein